LSRLGQRLAEPVDGASLAVFRIAFGLILGWEAAPPLLVADEAARPTRGSDDVRIP
jgi:hypothetical protein